MKIFRVTIDNDPGGWKSGLDRYVLIPAKTKEEAIEKMKNGFGERFVTMEENDGEYCYEYKPNGEVPYMSTNCRISAIEIRFEGYELINKRQAKLERILKDEN
jgi:hypothetical protein